MKVNFKIPPIVDPTQKVDYSMSSVPSNYVCHLCGASGVKLWREYNTFLDHQSLFCVVCSGKTQKKDINSINDRGLVDQEFGLSDQIGWRIPAVPNVENDTYWGYTSVPEDGVLWWKRLPAYPGGVRVIKVDDYNKYNSGTPEYVYYHGIEKKKRGKNLSAYLVLGNEKITNPKAAFHLAKLLLTDTENTLFGKPFLRSEIDWALKYAEHLEGPNAKISFSPTSGIDKCDCSNCFYRDAPPPYNPKRDCQMVRRLPQKFFGFVGPAANVPLPAIVYGKNLGHYCKHWLSEFAD